MTITNIDGDGRISGMPKSIETFGDIKSAQDAMAVLAIEDAKRILMDASENQDVKFSMNVVEGLPIFDIFIYSAGECFREIYWGIRKVEK